MEDLETKKDEEEIQQDIINLVVERLKSMPANVSIAVGGLDAGDYSRSDLIENVEKNTDVGKRIIDLQIGYIRSLKDITKNDGVSLNN